MLSNEKVLARLSLGLQVIDAKVNDDPSNIDRLFESAQYLIDSAEDYNCYVSSEVVTYKNMEGSETKFTRPVIKGKPTLYTMPYSKAADKYGIDFGIDNGYEYTHRYYIQGEHGRASDKIQGLSAKTLKAYLHDAIKITNKFIANTLHDKVKGVEC